MPSMTTSRSFPKGRRLDRPKAILMLRQGLKSQKLSPETRKKGEHSLRVLEKLEQLRPTSRN